MRQPKRRTALLTLTHRCNLACRYCYESQKDKSSVTLPLAQSAITRLFATSDDSDEIEITLHGGEPFLCFDLMRSLCEWTWQRCWPKPYIFFVTTNGTLVHGKIQDWCAANRERIYLGLSLDGTPPMHNANRSRSFDKIDVAFFRRTWPDQPVKMTVSDLTLPYLADGLIYLHQLGFLVKCSFAYGMDWTADGHTEVLGRELARLIDYYLSNPNVTPCDFLLPDVAAVGTQAPVDVLGGEGAQEGQRWCGIGSRMVAIDVDGCEYPCHLFLPFSAGEAAGIHESFDFARLARFRDSRCEGCVLLPICPTCYAMNLLQRENPSTRDPGLCVLTKLRALAASALLANMLVEHERFSATRELSAQELAAAITGVERIQAEVRMPKSEMGDGPVTARMPVQTLHEQDGGNKGRPQAFHSKRQDQRCPLLRPLGQTTDSARIEDQHDDQPA